MVVAGLWVRPLAESARRGGWDVIALDLFGDADTRRASVAWARIGDPSAFALSPALLQGELRHAARAPGVVGWVAGSGFEPIPEALAMEIPGLPLIGVPAAAVRRVRKPDSFFTTLRLCGLAHPEVLLQAPARPEGWLVKNSSASGGWHIRPADAAGLPQRGQVYWQRLQAGEPMSALFLADGRGARLVALNRLLVRPLGELPYVYHGAIGPVQDEALARRIESALALLVPAFGLRGLASLDFLDDGGTPWLLEVNPRPSASMVLHDDAWPGGLMRAHVDAAQGRLPREPAAHAAGLRGSLIVFADRPCRIGPEQAMALAMAPDCHDLPAPRTAFAPGEPVCSVSASGHDDAAVRAALDARAAAILGRLQSLEEHAA